MKVNIKVVLFGLAAFVAAVLILAASLGILIYISYGSDAIVILPQILHQ